MLYEFTEEAGEFYGRKLRQICALKDIDQFYAKAGDMGGEMTRNQLFVSGLRWPITISDARMTIACQAHDLRKWWKYSDATISTMHVDALKFWHANKAMLQAICKATGRDCGEEK